MIVALTLLAVALLGAALTAVLLGRSVRLGRARLDETSTILSAREQELATLRERLQRREEQLADAQAQASEARALFAQAKDSLGHTFDALAAEALRKNNQQFLDLARTRLDGQQEVAREELDGRRAAIEGLVKPLAEVLTRFDTTVRELEKTQGRAQGSLHEQLRQLSHMQNELQKETQTLARALKSSSVRGRWGEVQLRRVVELAGMLEHCDFVAQSNEARDGNRLRPDMLVRLPGDKLVVVDAKAPLAAFLQALEATTDEQRLAKLEEHGKAVRRHIQDLSSKEYHRAVGQSPELTIMFMPGEAFLQAALEVDRELLEHAAARGVLLATPTSLIGLLRAIAFGWRNEAVAQNAQRISEVGRLLHERLSVFAAHFSSLRKGIEAAVGAYNEAVGSFERRVLPAAEDLAQLGATSGKELAAPSVVSEPLREAPGPAGALPGPTTSRRRPESATAVLPGLEIVRGG